MNRKDKQWTILGLQNHVSVFLDEPSASSFFYATTNVQFVCGNPSSYFLTTLTPASQVVTADENGQFPLKEVMLYTPICFDDDVQVIDMRLLCAYA